MICARVRSLSRLPARICITAIATGCLLAASGPAQTRTGILRMVSYNIDCADQSSDANITGPAHSLPTVIEGIALHHLGTNVQQIDTLNVEELNSTTLSNFTAALTNIYGAGTYAYDTTVDNNTGGGPDGLIYNTRTIQVISGRCLPTGETVLLQSNGVYSAAHSPGGGKNGVTRGPLCYRLRPIGYGTNNDFYMYISHARSTSDDTQGDARYAEAQEVRSDAKYNLPAGSHILYAGDWNLFNGSGENAYKCLTGQVTSDGTNWGDTSPIWANTNQTQGYDPTSKTSPPTTTTWANLSSDHANYLYDDSTESGTYATTSRLDIQLPNALMYGAYNPNGGVELTPNASDPYDVSNFPASQYPYAFEVFGNNGSVTYGNPVTQAGNTSLADLAGATPNSTALINDIVEVTGSSFTGSDHYPIFGDYTIVFIQPPVVAFNASPTNGTAPLTVQFANLSTGATNYIWAFGDGNSSTLTNPANTYSSAGVYSVTLTAMGAGGANVVTLSNYIAVAGASPPVASFSANPTNGTAPLTVQFTNLSTGATNYVWEFGDGNSSGLTNPANTYSNAGVYSVTLTAIGAGGANVVTLSNYIAVAGASPPTVLAGSAVFSPQLGFQFTLSNSDGSSVTPFEQSQLTVYVSTDLTASSNWTILNGTMLLSNGVLELLDSNALLFPQRFYRVSVVP